MSAPPAGAPSPGSGGEHGLTPAALPARGMRSRGSLRRRVLVGASLTVALTLCAAGAAVYLLVKAALMQESTAVLDAQVRALAALVRLNPYNGRPELATPPGGERGGLPALFQVVAQDGRSVIAAPALGGAELPRRSGGTVERPAHWSGPLPDGRAGLGATLAFEVAYAPPPNGSSGHVHIHIGDFEYESEGREHGHEERHRGGGEARTPPAWPKVALTALAMQDTQGLDHQLGRLAWLLAMVGVGATLASCLVLALVVDHSLRPLRRLARAIARRGDDRLGAAVDIGPAPAELAPVVDRLNALLGRIGTALVRERGFSSDVSHELRTPLAGLLTTIDVCLRNVRGPDAYQHALRRCRRIAKQMQSMVESLLDLARLEHGSLTLRPRAVALPELVEKCWAPFAEVASARQAAVRWALAPVHAFADRERLAQVVGNLLDNAASYVDAGGTIRVESAVAADGRVRLLVVNTGSHIHAEQVAHIFDRFWRGDRARTGSLHHCGLGLSLCRRLASALGGELGVRSQYGGEFAVELLLPAADAAQVEAALALVDTTVMPGPGR